MEKDEEGFYSNEDLKEATLHERPNCDFCGLSASYDAKCLDTRWGYLCGQCFADQKCELGLGKGQRLIIK